MNILIQEMLKQYDFQSTEERDWLYQVFQNSTVLKQVACRTLLVQMIGAIKFLLKFDVEDLTVEAALYQSIASQLENTHLNFQHIRALFKILIECSKKEQGAFIHLYKMDKNPEKMALDHLIKTSILLKKMYPQLVLSAFSSEAFSRLVDENNRSEHELNCQLLIDSKMDLIEKLRLCRSIVQKVNHLLIESFL